MSEILTEKQKRFCDYYLETGNATEAARKAGYKGNNLNRIASENLSKLVIKSYLESRQREADNKRIATADEVLIYLTNVMRGQIKDQFDLDAPLQERTRAAEALAKRYRLYDVKDNKVLTDSEKEKEKLQLEELKLKNEKLKAEINRLTGNNQEIEDTSDIEGEIYD